jgi:hypothetical protein
MFLVLHQLREVLKVVPCRVRSSHCLNLILMLGAFSRTSLLKQFLEPLKHYPSLKHEDGAQAFPQVVVTFSWEKMNWVRAILILRV